MDLNEISHTTALYYCLPAD